MALTQNRGPARSRSLAAAFIIFLWHTPATFHDRPETLASLFLAYNAIARMSTACPGVKYPLSAPLPGSPPGREAPRRLAKSPAQEDNTGTGLAHTPLCSQTSRARATNPIPETLWQVT